MLSDDREIPAWIDEAIMRAVHPDPRKRVTTNCPEFVFDLHLPNSAFLSKIRPPALIERNPVIFWKVVSVCPDDRNLVVLGMETTVN
ncbi:MAG: hypothetical protein IPK89_10495 [Sphingomonadales bacterium]|nr:hypothetical protein [Sphingomonadales bacterium]